jgi:cellulose synthase/poly-beta-1,6-N-acetylglucosamine synthase-like glycosyltransferase
MPPRGVVAGNPARPLSRQGSFELIVYPGMHSDPARRASLSERDEPEREVSTRSSNGCCGELFI